MGPGVEASPDDGEGASGGSGSGSSCNTGTVTFTLPAVGGGGSEFDALTRKVTNTHTTPGGDGEISLRFFVAPLPAADTVAAIPSLSVWGLMGLSGLLACLGMRRRKQA